VADFRFSSPRDRGLSPPLAFRGGGAIMGDGLAGINESMADLAWRLSWYLERPALDRAGNAGSFDFRVEYRSGHAQAIATTQAEVTTNEHLIRSTGTATASGCKSSAQKRASA
jgi:hypothetical protein